MKVLLIHNHYQQPGGEDQVFAAEAALLEAHGHQVLLHTVHNDEVANTNPVALAGSTIWNRSSYRELRSLIRRERPHVTHFHNTLPLISPAGYYAAKAEGVPVVQTLHNYRLLCPNALFFRDGHVCEDCQGKSVPWPSVLHACYRGSRPASAAVAAMLTTHRGLRTWRDQVDVYVATTEFAREKFVQGGLPPEKVVVKPNFLHTDPRQGEGRGDYALFVGRLSHEKGVGTLLSAWKRLGARMPLKIVGDGPLAEEVGYATEGLYGLEWLGRQPQERVLALMKEASVLVFPSTCYENFPVTLLEAFAAGLPVIASNLGGMSSLVVHGRTGLHFRPGDPEDLSAKVEWALAHPTRLADMRSEARAEFEAKYTAERNYVALKEIYETAAS
ncbi:MAG TPA: glycosyltransferase [Rubrobacteraceae bacterium]|nr:glycosyltransferase [Rubrobacteraceae bacterium]